MILAAMEFKISKHKPVSNLRTAASLITPINANATTPADKVKISSVIPQFLRR
jgi:hypothetical protein